MATFPRQNRKIQSNRTTAGSRPADPAALAAAFRGARPKIPQPTYEVTVRPGGVTVFLLHITRPPTPDEIPFVFMAAAVFADAKIGPVGIVGVVVVPPGEERHQGTPS